jgi:hypothetical protein
MADNYIHAITVIYDNRLPGDDHIVIERDQDGRVYETNNAATRQLVSPSLFTGWGDEYLRSIEWHDALTDLFDGNSRVAKIYQDAAIGCCE